MKTIALLPFKNEKWILPTYLSNVLPIVDQIIAINDGSTDGGEELLKGLPNVEILSEYPEKKEIQERIQKEEEKEKGKQEKRKEYKKENLKSGWAEFNIRKTLLDAGRAAGGTHFVCLDADETFTSNFVPLAKKLITKLEPGQKLVLQWLALWKTVDHYRDDQSVWSNNYKDFIVCDDPSLDHDYAFLGVGRTPGQNNDKTWLKLNPKFGAVLHYQFSNWTNFQLKQCWYRCSELIKMPGMEAAINQKYSITLDDPNAKVTVVPDSWLKGIPNPEIDDLPPSWHLEKIKEWFEEYGSSHFNKLNIWHVPEIQAIRNNK